jgi:hypothetical protein
VTAEETKPSGGLGVLGTFAVVGPPAGGLVVAATWLRPAVAHALDDADPTGIPGLVLLVVAFSYVVGLAPAVAAGLLCAVTSPVLRSTPAWLFGGVVAGGLAAVAMLGGWIALSGGVGLDIAGVLAATGGFAGLCGAALSRNDRPGSPRGSE